VITRPREGGWSIVWTFIGFAAGHGKTGSIKRYFIKKIEKVKLFASPTHAMKYFI
jgi:hypothetical protein